MDPPTVETWSPNHRTARDVPYLFFKIKEITGCLYADENDLVKLMQERKKHFGMMIFGKGEGMGSSAQKEGLALLWTFQSQDRR